MLLRSVPYSERRLRRLKKHDFAEDYKTKADISETVNKAQSMAGHPGYFVGETPTRAKHEYPWFKILDSLSKQGLVRFTVVLSFIMHASDPSCFGMTPLVLVFLLQSSASAQLGFGGQPHAPQ